MHLRQPRSRTLDRPASAEIMLGKMGHSGVLDLIVFCLDRCSHVTRVSADHGAAARIPSWARNLRGQTLHGLAGLDRGASGT